MRVKQIKKHNLLCRLLSIALVLSMMCSPCIEVLAADYSGQSDVSVSEDVVTANFTVAGNESMAVTGWVLALYSDTPSVGEGVDQSGATHYYICDSTAANGDISVSWNFDSANGGITLGEALNSETNWHLAIGPRYTDGESSETKIAITKYLGQKSSFYTPPTNNEGTGGAGGDGSGEENQTHEHSWVYKLGDTNDTILAECTNENCELVDVTKSLILTAEDKEHSGNPYNGASFTSDLHTVVGIEAPIIYYVGVNETVYESSDVPPTEIGEYKATVTVENITAEVEFNIITPQQTPQPGEYTLTVNEGTGSGNYNEGDEIEITANAAPENKEFDAWTGLDNIEILEGDINTPTIRIKMPANNLDITATYKDVVVTPNSHAIKIIPSVNGVVEATKYSAVEGDSISLVITPAEGYMLDTISVKDASGQDVELDENKVFKMPDSEITIEATFKLEKLEPLPEDTYSIILNTTSFGSISADKSSAKANELITITFKPDNGYTLDTVTVVDANSNPVYIQNGKLHILKKLGLLNTKRP